ncbi:hypothetical protein MASR2M79_06090 [Aminivibrio sp.]
MDALRLHLSGFPETCASLGTALTEEQALLIRRLTDRCYICYDSDLAGQEAAVKGMYVLQKVGLRRPGGGLPGERTPVFSPPRGAGDILEGPLLGPPPCAPSHSPPAGDALPARKATKGR